MLFRVRAVFLQFGVGQVLDQDAKWSVLSLASSKEVLFASVSDFSMSYVIGFRWKDLEKKRLKISWKIDSQCNRLPVDVNSIVVDELGSTHGRIFVAGGGPLLNQDKSIKIFDIETSTESRAPMTGHDNYIHALNYCHVANSLASASEDGTARLWDPRTKSGQIQLIRAFRSSVIGPSGTGQLGRCRGIEWRLVGRWRRSPARPLAPANPFAHNDVTARILPPIISRRSPRTQDLRGRTESHLWRGIRWDFVLGQHE